MTRGPQTTTENRPNWSIPGAGITRAMRDAIAFIGGMKVTDNDAERVILRARELGVEVIYTEQVEQWGEMAGCCVGRETGKQCPFCRCEGKNMQ